MTARPSARREGVGIVRFYSILTRQTSFQDDVLRGLALPQKAIPPKYFYDERGSQLFERICELPEYYPTRTEMALMERHVDEMVPLLEFARARGAVASAFASFPDRPPCSPALPPSSSSPSSAP